jgi:hypothetical protein
MGKFFIISHNKQTTCFRALHVFLPYRHELSPKTSSPYDMSNCPKQRQQQILSTCKTSQRQGDDNDNQRQALEAQCASSPGMFFISLFNKITINLQII